MWIKKDDAIKENHTWSVPGHSKASEPDRKCYSSHPVNTAGQSCGCLSSTRATCAFCVITDHRPCLLTQSDFSIISTFMKQICILPDNPYVLILHLDDTLSDTCFYITDKIQAMLGWADTNLDDKQKNTRRLSLDNYSLNTNLHSFIVLQFWCTNSPSYDPPARYYTC